MTQRILSVESGFSTLQGDMRNLEERVDTMEQRMEDKVDGMLAGRTRGGFSDSQHMGQIQTVAMESLSARDGRYWKASKNLQMWPIEGEGEQMRNNLMRFLAQELRLGEDVLQDAEECLVRRVPRNKSTKIASEVVVQFPTVDLRDVVRGAAYNLAGNPQAGIRLEIAHHLMNNFKALSHASYKLKQKYTECKRNIKYDDERCDLVLEFKTDPEAQWRRLRPEEAKQVKDEAKVNKVTASDMSELLSSDGRSTEDTNIQSD